MGLWGAAIGTAAAVGLPLFAAAMSNASEQADELRTKLEGIAQATREAERQYEQFLSGARTREEADALKLVEEAHAAVARQIQTVNATHRAESKVIQEGILAQLREEHYGYSLRKALATAGIAVEEGTLYPLIRRLEKQGLLASEWREEDKRKKRYYRLSAEGERALAVLHDEWLALNASIGGLLNNPTRTRG